MNSEQKSKIIEALTKKPYIYYLPISIFIFVLINFFTNEIYVVGLKVFHFPIYIWLPYISFTFINTFLVGLSVNLSIMKFRELGTMSRRGGFFGLLGTIFALATGACPGCVAGLFPVFVGIFGATITLNSLPLYGMELQIISLILLIVGIYYLAKGTTCKIKVGVKSSK